MDNPGGPPGVARVVHPTKAFVNVRASKLSVTQLIAIVVMI